MTDTTSTAAAAEQARREQWVTDQVAASFEGTSSPRYREIMQALVRHAHAVLREIRLTEQEWESAVDFLTRCGRITTDKRQEFVLLSDVLGLSMLTIAINQPAAGDATEATVLGPFFVEGAPEVAIGGDIAQGVKGQPCWVEGTVADTAGQPVPGARIEVWEADDDGFYDVQYPDTRTTGRAHLYSDGEGRYAFWGVTPTPYPIPYDGPVGELLTAAGRGPMRPAHLHFMVTAPGYRRLVTHAFAAGDDYLTSDAVFGVKRSLIISFEEQPAEATPPPGREVTGTWARARFDLVLAPAGSRPPGDTGSKPSRDG